MRKNTELGQIKLFFIGLISINNPDNLNWLFAGHNFGLYSTTPGIISH